MNDNRIVFLNKSNSAGKQHHTLTLTTKTNITPVMELDWMKLRIAINATTENNQIHNINNGQN